MSGSGNESTLVAEISGTKGAGAGAGAAGTDAGAAFVLAVLDREEELGEAWESGASGPSIIIETMRHAIMVFET
jgi:hypothetical protein